MIVHQHIGVKNAPRMQQSFAKQLEITVSIAVIEKTKQSIIATLHDVLRNIGEIKSRLACHARSFIAWHVLWNGHTSPLHVSFWPVGTKQSEPDPVSAWPRQIRQAVVRPDSIRRHATLGNST